MALQLPSLDDLIEHDEIAHLIGDIDIPSDSALESFFAEVRNALKHVTDSILALYSHCPSFDLQILDAKDQLTNAAMYDRTAREFDVRPEVTWTELAANDVSGAKSRKRALEQQLAERIAWRMDLSRTVARIKIAETLAAGGDTVELYREEQANRVRRSTAEKGAGLPTGGQGALQIIEDLMTRGIRVQAELVVSANLNPILDQAGNDQIVREFSMTIRDDESLPQDLRKKILRASLMHDKRLALEARLELHRFQNHETA